MLVETAFAVTSSPALVLLLLKLLEDTFDRPPVILQVIQTHLLAVFILGHRGQNMLRVRTQNAVIVPKVSGHISNPRILLG